MASSRRGERREEAMASGRGGERREGGGERRRLPWVQYRQRQELLPRDEILGGYIFVCDDTTMAEGFDRQLFGLPEFYRDSVRTIRPGTPLFLSDSNTRLLYGTFEASSFGNYNIDPTAWQENNGAGSPPRSRFPAQVRMRERRMRPLIHHYAPFRFRLPITVTEALNIMDAFDLNGGYFGYYYWNVRCYWNGYYWIPTFQPPLYI